MCSHKRLFVIVIAKLIALSIQQSFTPALTGRCNECFSNGIACLDEQNFAVCIGNTPSTINTPCPAGAVCTAEENICLATAEGALPACYEDQCGRCSSIRNNFACLDVATYAFCYDGQTPAASSINHCPQGYVCDLQNTGICSSSQLTIPTCMPLTTDTTTDSTTDTTTDTITDTTTVTTTVTTTDSSTGGTSDTTADTTTVTTTSINTVETTAITADTTTDLTTDSTTDTTADTITQVTTSRITDITTDIKTDTTTDSIIVTPTDSTTISPTDDITDTTTVTTSVLGTSTTTNTTPNITPIDPNAFCADVGRKGNFRLVGDKTCASYIYCYRLSGQYLGWRYTCSYYFNAATGLCQIDRPAGC